MKGGFIQINEKYTTLEVFIDECCTTTLAAAGDPKINRGRNPI
jgi:hypothetical protein